MIKNDEKLYKGIAHQDEIAIEIRDPNHDFKIDNVYTKLIEIINSSKKLNKIGENRLTWEQSEILKSMDNNESIYIQASTSFGKTWLSIHSILKKISILDKKISDISFDENDLKYTVLIIVPTDLLQTQIINNIKNECESENYNINISEEYEGQKKYNIIVGTAEKIYPQIENIKNINLLLVDEAHEIFYESDRSKFYKFTIEAIIKNYNPTLWMIGAFIEKEKMKKYKLKMFEPKGFKSFYFFQYDKDIYLENKVISEGNFRPKGRVLYFYQSIKELTEDFNNEIRKIKNKELKYANRKNDILNQTAVDFIEKLDKSFFQEENDLKDDNVDRIYNVILGLKIGIVPYHSKMPSELKSIIFYFLKNKFVDKILSTSAIQSGLDFDIDNIYIKNLKRNKKYMEPQDLLNLAGRIKRYRPKQTYSIGQVKIKKNNENLLWFQKKENKEKLKERKINDQKDIFEDEYENIKYNIDESIRLINKKDELLDYFLIDPRIHPKITKKVVYMDKKKYLEIYNRIQDVKEDKNSIKFFNKTNDYNNWEETYEKIYPFLKIYTEEHGFKSCYTYKDISKIETKSDGSIKRPSKKWKAIRFFIKMIRDENEQKIFRDQAYGASKNTFTEFSKTMEDSSEVFYKEVKYALYSYYKHFIKIGKRTNKLN